MPGCEYVQILTFCEGACSFFQRCIECAAVRAPVVAMEAAYGGEPFADIAATCSARIGACGS